VIAFRPSAGPTLGVELELQLLDAGTLGFRSAAPDLLRALPASFGERIKQEFLQCMVEVTTGVCRNVREAEEDLRGALAHLGEALAGMGVVYYAAGLHPWEVGTGRNLMPDARYARILEDLQIVGRRFITQGLHVHIGVSSADRAVRLNDTLRLYLPLLLALSTSSPFHAGEDTGLFSYRTKLFEALPLAGLPDSLGTWDEFAALVDLLVSGGIVEGVRDLWWDVRPHPDFGTVEVRICDLPARFADVLALAALIQALVHTYENIHVHPDARVRMQVLRANKWQALRYGLEGVFINPFTARRTPIREAVRDLLALVEPAARRLGGLQALAGVEDILARGTGAHRQREVYAESGDFRTVIETLRGEFLA
jgi:carboxylate-amine ligase